MVNNAICDIDDGSTATFTNPSGTNYTVVLRNGFQLADYRQYSAGRFGTPEKSYWSKT